MNPAVLPVVKKVGKTIRRSSDVTTFEFFAALGLNMHDEMSGSSRSVRRQVFISIRRLADQNEEIRNKSVVLQGFSGIA